MTPRLDSDALRVLKLMEHHTYKQIGEILGKSEGAVSRFVQRRIFNALGVDRQTEAVARAIREKIIA